MLRERREHMEASALLGVCLVGSGPSLPGTVLGDGPARGEEEWQEAGQEALPPLGRPVQVSHAASRLGGPVSRTTAPPECSTGKTANRKARLLTRKGARAAATAQPPHTGKRTHGPDPVP